MSYRVLVAEDEETSRFLLQAYCQDQQYDLTFAKDGREAMAVFQAQDFDLFITDVRLPGVDGETLLKFAREIAPEVPVIVITGYGTIDGAVNFLRLGAFDYIAKPFARDAFLHRLALAVRNIDLTQEVHRLRRRRRVEAMEAIVTADPQMLRLLSQLPSVAKTSAAVVIYGESGTGKELVANAVHALSPRADKPYVSVSCAALPDTLIESELFGHVRGAFTDAYADRAGLIAEAETGTLFLDEVGELPIATQVKLLRFLQEREFKPVGSNAIQHADVRIVAATNRNLEEAVAEGIFREDLYYRLNVIPVNLPPLRERGGDVELLANHCLRRFAEDNGSEVKGLSADVLAAMAAYAWPGNVRELINCVQRMVVTAGSGWVPLEAWKHIEESGRPASEVGVRIDRGFAEEKKQAVERFENEYLKRALEQAEGNVSQAARLAGIDRKNFWALMKRRGIEAESFRRAKTEGRPS